MPDIPTITDTLKALDEAIESLKIVRRFIKGTGEVFGVGQVQAELPLNKHSDIGDQTPRTYGERIIAIMRDNGGRPMRPVEIVDEYRRRQWPVPPAGKLDSSIRSNIFWLKKKVKISHIARTGRYKLVENIDDR